MSEKFELVWSATELEALAEIKIEYEKAVMKHGSMHGMHEGYAVLLEELDEAWEAIMKDDKESALKEIAQVGAMALRFIVNIGGEV